MKRSSMALALTGGGLVVALGAGFAIARPGDGSREMHQNMSVRAVADCRTVATSEARLACYDAAAAKLDQAQASGDLVCVDREQRGEVRRQAFGLNLPSLSIFDRGDQEPGLNKLTLKVVEAHEGPHGWVVTLEGGQVWRQIDSTLVSHVPKPGSVATVTRATLGSYMLSVDGHPGFKAHRDN